MSRHAASRTWRSGVLAPSGDAKAGGQPRSCAARQRDRDVPQHPGQQRRLARVALGQAVDLLGERLARAGQGRAEEPPDRQHDPFRAAAQRSVGQLPGITAVDPARYRPAPRARSFGGHAPWLSRAAARPPPRPPRRSPRLDEAAERPERPNPGMTRTRRLATMTPRTRGRTAGLDDRWTTRSPFTSPCNATTTDTSAPERSRQPGRGRLISGPISVKST